MTEPSHAVFLSYASEDAPAAQRIAAALRAAGIDVWFDQSELRGGDAWDRQIRQQIHDCRLFIALISAHTEARDEGYFRREWSLAADRTRDMAYKRAFLVPVAIDGTPERGASVPEKFHELQWTRLPDGETPPPFVERIQRLLSPEAPPARAALPVSAESVTVQAYGGSVPPPWRTKAALWIAGAVVTTAVAYIAVDKLPISRHAPPPVPGAPPTQTARPTSATVFSPPPHSIAVLPFVNMSGDKEQEYFSDGLSEELLNDLTRINELQVAARTSAFSFKGKDTDIGTIARKLNVGAVLEGSVRRSAHTVRVSTQLINAVTGFHMWSQTYDRDLGDMLKLQTEIAEAVASALKVTLLGEVAARIEAGGTRNPAAFDAYLRASKIYFPANDDTELQAAIAGYSEAIRLDPGYALAWASRSLARMSSVSLYATGTAARESINKAEADGRQAISLAPSLGEGRLALAVLYEKSFDFTRAAQEYQLALALAPGNARLLKNYGQFAVAMGQTEPGLAAASRAVLLDPLNPSNHGFLGVTMVMARRYDEALIALNNEKALDANAEDVFTVYAYYGRGDFESARAIAESLKDERGKLLGLSIVCEKLGRHAEAAEALVKLQASAFGAAHPTLSAMTYAQWGDRSRALDYLDAAVRQHDPLLEFLKSFMLYDPLRQEPRFQAVMRELKFPD